MSTTQEQRSCKTCHTLKYPSEFKGRCLTCVQCKEAAPAKPKGKKTVSELDQFVALMGKIAAFRKNRTNEMYFELCGDLKQILDGKVQE